VLDLEVGVSDVCDGAGAVHGLGGQEKGRSYYELQQIGRMSGMRLLSALLAQSLMHDTTHTVCLLERATCVGCSSERGLRT